MGVLQEMVLVGEGPVVCSAQVTPVRFAVECTEMPRCCSNEIVSLIWKYDTRSSKFIGTEANEMQMLQLWSLLAFVINESVEKMNDVK